MARAHHPGGRPQVIDYAEIARVYIAAVATSGRRVSPVRACQEAFGLDYRKMAKRLGEVRQAGWLPAGQVPLRADDPGRVGWLAEARRLLESQIAQRRAIEVARRQLLAERETAVQLRRTWALEQRRQGQEERAAARDQLLARQAEARAERKAVLHEAAVRQELATRPERLARKREYNHRYYRRKQLYTRVEQAPLQAPLTPRLVLDEFLRPAWFG